MSDSVRAEAWRLFDQVTADAPLRSQNPWHLTSNGAREYVPDYRTLQQLLAIPLNLAASSQSGAPALALDVWIAYELRRAGFDPDRVWPRAAVPRVLPGEISALLGGLPRNLRAQLQERLDSGRAPGVTLAAANLLGKNYVKQVDVVMSSWQTGPELMISTKRMDSSFGKNAANRVEESYGDAKNLRLRHPQAALGFFYSLRATALTREPDQAAWLIDLLAKLGREDDAYDAVGLIIPDWHDQPDHAEPGDDDTEDALAAAGLAEVPEPQKDDLPASLPADHITSILARLPEVRIRHDVVPAELSPARFLAAMTDRVLNASPINFHSRARQLQRNPAAAPPSKDGA
jgi:hypothetical protein